MGIICILMFFCSYVLIYNVTLSQESNLWTCIVLSLAFVFPLRWGPWSLPGMTCRGHSATFSGCILFKRQKNIRCGCSILFCFFKNVFRKVNTSLACYMNIQKYVRSLLIDGLMDVHDLHSYVLLFFCLYSLFTSCLWWNCFCLYVTLSIWLSRCTWLLWKWLQKCWWFGRFCVYSHGWTWIQKWKRTKEL